MPLNQELLQRGDLVTHADLLKLLADRDEEGYRKAIGKHLSVYRIFLKNMRNHE